MHGFSVPQSLRKAQEGESMGVGPSAPMELEGKHFDWPKDDDLEDDKCATDKASLVIHVVTVT